MRIPSRVKSHATGPANSSPYRRLLKEDPFGGQCIQMRRFDNGMPHAGHTICPHLVGHNEEDVQTVAGHVRSPISHLAKIFLQYFIQTGNQIVGVFLSEYHRRFNFQDIV